jgi:hypothetical protein
MSDTTPDQTHKLHVYVQPGHLQAPANQAAPTNSHLYVEPSKPSEQVYRPGPHVKVLSDLPDLLPVLPQEVALIRAYLPALLALIAANDNDASHV